MCTPAEYRQIQALSKTAQAQKTQRDIEEMRAYQVQLQTRNNQLQPRRARKNYDERQQTTRPSTNSSKPKRGRLRRQPVISVSARTRSGKLPNWRRCPLSNSRSTLQQNERGRSTLPKRWKSRREAVLATIEQDENDLRQKWQNAQMSRGLKRETQTEAGPDQRVQRLRVT